MSTTAWPARRRVIFRKRLPWAIRVGEPIRVSGAFAYSNPIRFSTKYTDDETDWVYYGYRYYN
jgi:RHS repeat-associated protein